ncbi:nuclear transport factor 2 family protein [Microbulbifer sp. OS29]|uniref:Nuclear transport factor 2 family protein n=1 Tax=Microbulbifer okhotskensis TaxID=2926617 RepID=A0A9X2EK06_9GAMM|nr:nuclear transport factor 2 family protein [Microbulbifer okhotskensis]MCO1333652.1 nuclear transport factor 2 family protein [Microbulbifer okhotskensis]
MMLKKFYTLVFIGLSFLSFFTLAEQHPVVSGPQVTQELTNEILAADQVLFDAAFNNCDIEALRPLVAKDLEMYHDKWGKTASSGEEFLNIIVNMCKQRRDGSGLDARRKLVTDSVKIYPVNHYGAIQTGTHLFYGIYDDKKGEVLRESAQFTHLWQKVGGKWQLARILSFDHQPAAQPSQQ